MKPRILATLVPAVVLLAGCRHPVPPRDYVSAYDFKGALLSDLPWQVGAAVVGPQTSFDYDDCVKRHHPDWNYVQYRLGLEPFIELCYQRTQNLPWNAYVVDDPSSLIVPYSRIDNAACRLEDGLLWAYPQCSGGVVGLEAYRSHDPLLEIETVGYLDYNHDGYMDVKVRRRLPGSAMPVEELVLSRRQPGGMFYVVAVLDSSIRDPGKL